MATTTTSPNDLTRQQLDELDALLQRMLALPIHANDPVAPPLPELTPSRTAPQMSRGANGMESAPRPQMQSNEPTATVLSAKFSAKDLAAPAESFTPSPAFEFAPSASTGTLRGVDAPAMPYGYTPVPLDETAESMLSTDDRVASALQVNPFAPYPTSLTLAIPDAAPARTVPMLHLPMYAFNWLIEAALGWFGPLGALLTRPAVKSALGVLGLLMICAAGYWSARGLGYASWPKGPWKL